MVSCLSTRVWVPCPNPAGCPGRSAPGRRGRRCHASLRSHCRLQSLKLPEGGGFPQRAGGAVAFRGSGPRVRPPRELPGWRDRRRILGQQPLQRGGLPAVRPRPRLRGSRGKPARRCSGSVRAGQRPPAAGRPPRPFLPLSQLGHSQVREDSFLLVLSRESERGARRLARAGKDGARAGENLGGRPGLATLGSAASQKRQSVASLTEAPGAPRGDRFGVGALSLTPVPGLPAGLLCVPAPPHPGPRFHFRLRGHVPVSPDSGDALCPERHD